MGALYVLYVISENTVSHFVHSVLDTEHLLLPERSGKLIIVCEIKVRYYTNKLFIGGFQIIFFYPGFAMSIKLQIRYRPTVLHECSQTQL
jgi:hypothetical protein